MATMRVEVVSTERMIFSGEAEFLVAPGQEGEIGIYPRHVPLLTRIMPGVLRMRVSGQTEEVLVAVSGGMIEIQPTHITVLADTAVRWEDLDEARANEAKRAAEDALRHSADDLATARAHAALAMAIAQLKTLDYMKNRRH